LCCVGNFSDTGKYSCKGCQDGYLTESLVTHRFWSYVQLPIDGMKSMVFHGPSPTLCVASGEYYEWMMMNDISVWLLF
jgi:hypothetical protein